MPSVARDRIAETADYGVVEDRHEDVNSTTIQFLTFREDVDAAPLMRGLPTTAAIARTGAMSSRAS
jgi:hypothetical protein